MTIILPAVGVAFAALCVWLCVRIVNRRDRRANWIALALLILAYPMSFGPVCRIMLPPGKDTLYAPRIYWPIGWAAKKSGFVRSAAGWYVGLLMPNNIKWVTVPIKPSGSGTIIWASEDQY